MKLFTSHEVLDLTDDEKKSLKCASDASQTGIDLECPYHSLETLSVFCMQCRVKMRLFFKCVRFLFA